MGYFITAVVRVLGKTPEMMMRTSDLGGIQEIKTAWTSGNLHNAYKMVEIIRERSDLFEVRIQEKNALVYLTDMGKEFTEPEKEIPDPDRSCRRIMPKRDF